jgi:hypothetical protein
MKKNLSVIFSICILTLNAKAASSSNNNENTSKKLIQIEKQIEPPPQDPVLDSEDKETVQATQPRELKLNKPDFFYSDSQAIWIHSGAIYSIQTAGSVLYGLMGLSYAFPSENRFHYEVAFDISGNQEGHFLGIAKWTTHSTERVRPFLNAGLGIKVLPQDNVGVILSVGRLLAQVGTGLEYSFTAHTSLKAETFAGVDLGANVYVAAILGYGLSF